MAEQKDALIPEFAAALELGAAVGAIRAVSEVLLELAGVQADRELAAKLTAIGRHAFDAANRAESATYAAARLLAKAAAQDESAKVDP